jgi:hypothetical protein
MSSNRDHRPKASELYRNANLVFVAKTTFKEAFPQIDDITVEVGETGYGTTHYLREPSVRVYKNGSSGEYLDCSNPRCYNGGVSVGNMIRKMIQEKNEEYETSTTCRGNEGSPKGHRVYRKCLNCFTIKVNLRYKARYIITLCRYPLSIILCKQLSIPHRLERSRLRKGCLAVMRSHKCPIFFLLLLQRDLAFYNVFGSVISTALYNQILHLLANEFWQCITCRSHGPAL